jgi:galactan beta-1,4-galactosyltransferase
MIPDWGYDCVYTLHRRRLTFPSNPNAGGKLLVHAYYSIASRQYERFVVL